MFQLVQESKTPLDERLYRAIKEAIINRTIEEYIKLTSKRKLADYLAVNPSSSDSRNRLLTSPHVRKWINSVLAPASPSYLNLQGRLPSCYSPVSH